MPTQANPRKPDPAFTRALLRDVRALQRILEEGRIETGVRRVGAEQEMILVDDQRRPAPVAMEVLAALDDPRYAPELARFNVEVNARPVPVEPTLLSGLEVTIGELVARVQTEARRFGAEVVLTGILPCLQQRDLSLQNMTPKERYHRLNEATMALAGGRLLMHIAGIDELRVEHDSMMIEACNTSFQVHLQVEPDEFAGFYNAAQLVLAPVLSAAANSPFLFGKRLWAETRIAVFRQTIDARTSSPSLRELVRRVRFGDAWVERGVAEVFEHDVINFRTMVTREPDEDPMAVLDAGGVPELQCLQLHNSTVYRWNRPCYGITDGKPHLRIECRALPSGPTITDEVANAAFWLGLVREVPERYPDLPERIDFADVRANFIAAARRGLNTSLTWLDEETISAPKLIRDRLLPLAADGLDRLGVDRGEATRYLDIIDRRVAADLTGTRWLEKSAQALAGVASRPERCATLTSAMIVRQQSGRPVHEWTVARVGEGTGPPGPTVDQFMTTHLFTVPQDELVDLAAFIMDREGTRQILVEDEEFRLVGLISYRSLLRLLAEGRLRELSDPVPVHEIMTRDPLTVPPDTPLLEAICLMRERELSSLPVVQDGQLVGILSERDFLPLAAEMLDRETPELHPG